MAPPEGTAHDAKDGVEVVDNPPSSMPAQLTDSWRSASRDGEGSQTVIDHVLGRLKAIGISHVFGVAGDYAFPVDRAIVKSPGIEWVGRCNELNAAYAADDCYGRVRRISAVSTIYGVGELSAINGQW
jgi:hypothetical protein